MTFMVVIAKEYQETVFPFGNILITIWLVSVYLCLIQVDNYGFYNFAEKFEVWNSILGGKWQISSLSNIRIFKLIIRIFISVNIPEYIRIIIIPISSHNFIEFPQLLKPMKTITMEFPAVHDQSSYAFQHHPTTLNTHLILFLQQKIAFLYGYHTQKHHSKRISLEMKKSSCF